MVRGYKYRKRECEEIHMLCMIMNLKQKEIKIKPRTKLNHNTYITNNIHSVIPIMTPEG